MTVRSRRQARRNRGVGSASVKSGESVPQTPVSFNSITVRHGRNALFAIAIIYAFLAGFRTVHDYDLGWQLATARWMVQHHSIPSTDVITYTVRGKPWIYPVLSGLTLYGLFVRWGYSALTWLLAIASAGIMVLLTRQNRLLSANLAVIAVPLIVNRLTPRADAFSMVLFAAVLSLLWQYYRTGKARLWLLPVLMLVWVNLHWGFVFGLGLCGAYVFLEAGEFCFAGQRAAALERLRRAWPWLLASGLATLVNPWGPRLYLQVFAWSKNLASPEAATIQEFLPLRISWTNLFGGLLGGHNSEIFWMLCVAGIAAIVAIGQKKPAESALLVGSALAAVDRVRFSAMFACVVVVVGGSILSDALVALSSSDRRRWIPANSHAATALILSLPVFATGLAAVRSYNLVSNHYYLGTTSPMLFGTGLSWWYPERALAFVEHEHLPRNLFNLYELGGFLAWRLPQYGDFVESRGWPFFVEQVRTSTELASSFHSSSR